MTLVFLALVGGLILASILYTKTIYNLFAILATPYLVIVLINQYIASPYFGFFKISDDTLIMLIEGLFAFFIGSIPFSKNNQLDNQTSFEAKSEKYNMKAMSVFVLICGLICFVQAFLHLLQNDQIVESFDDITASLNEGWAAHLKLVVLSVVPITLYYGLKKHDFISIIGTLLVFIAVFLSFIKYNIICPIAASIIFIALSDKKLAKRALLAMLIIPIGLFILNYYIGFFARGASGSVDSSFYLNHLWAYIGGSLIYDNYIFTYGIRIGVGAIEKLMTFVFAFPNMFIGKLFGIRLFPHLRQPDLMISSGYEQSNVVDAIGYLYPSYGNVSDVFEFIIVILLIGMLFSFLFRFMLNRSIEEFNTTIAYFLAEFVLMSFFGTFYINSGPWEQLIWCAIVPRLFINKEGRESNSVATPGRRPSNVF